MYEIAARRRPVGERITFALLLSNRFNCCKCPTLLFLWTLSESRILPDKRRLKYCYFSTVFRCVVVLVFDSACEGPMSSTPELFLIEDNPDDRDLFSRAVKLSGLNLRVTCAKDAPEAVLRLNRIGKFAGTSLPDLIILDLSLPGLQGKTLLQVIRSAYNSRSVPVVILTGSAREHDKAECESMGISEYALKPESLFELTQFVSSLVHFFPDVSATGRVAAINDRAGELR